MSIKTNEINIMSRKETDLIESKNRHLMEKIIKNWLKLQKIIKEEMTLEDIIFNHQEKEFVQLKEYFKKFYTLKLKNRQIFEEINNPQKKRNYLIDYDLKNIIDIYSSIDDFLFLFRNNYDYILTLIGLISDDDENEKIFSLAELFSNQFYENILIPNPEKEEVLLLIFKLFEKEISQLCCSSIDEFLEEDTFLGKFISSFNKKQELNGILLSIINPLITDIESSSSGNYLNLSLYDLKDIFKNSPSVNIDLEEDFNINEFLFDKIPKININFYKNKTNNEDGEEQSEESSEELEDKNIDLDMDKIPGINDWENNELKDDNDDDNSKNKNDEFNELYMKDLDMNYFIEKMKDEENPFLKDLYLYQIQQIIDDENIFSNKCLFDVLKSNKFKQHIKLIGEKYKNNFIYLKSKIDYLIQSLFDKIDSIPYSIRCVCKVIFIILKNKYPSLNKYLQNSFIGKYIFNKCLFPILNRENITILSSQILSIDTENCFNIIKNVLDHANKCALFKSNADLEYTIFNHYILELIPALDIFYEKLIDIELPPVLNNIIVNKYLNAQERKISSEIFFIGNNNNSTYDYFKENNEELFHLQCICFSLEDILFILTLINRNIDAFNSLENFEKFKYYYEIIEQSENTIKEIIKKNKDITQFFVSFKQERNLKFESYNPKNINFNNILKNNNSNLSTENLDNVIISQKFKVCLKMILRGLNLINNKDYSHLNSSFSNKNFFSCLKYTLDEFGELNDDKKRIPLKWYGEFIYTNKNLLQQKYLENDYEFFYDELYIEEVKNLNDLKSISSLVNVRDGMNLRCAENIVHKATYENFILDKNKDFIGISKFIEEENIEVCFQIKENGLNNNENNNETPDKNKKRIKKPANAIISIIDAEKCPHNQLTDIKKEKNKFKINPYHAYSIKDFISKFSDNPWNNEEKAKIPKDYITEDINKSQRNNGIYSTFSQYKSIIKKHIKCPKNNKINFLSVKNESIYTEIANKIEDFIMRQIYVYIYPKKQLKTDLAFYNMTKKLDWVKPEHLDIKKVYIKQLANAILWIKKIDEKKSIRDKLLCISSAYNIMNNTIKFSSGKNEDAGQDELTPIFQYIIIKAQLPRIFSNINYIKCFLNDIELTGELGFLFSQLESAACFIKDINNESFKLSEEEFNKKMNGI